MVISKTPFRISFAGGSTDLKSFYETEGGAVVSTSINKYMYITVNKRFDDTIRASYSKTEIVDTLDDLKHPIIRECLRLADVKKGVEITSIADVPAGTGLGSSSAFTVGLLNALYAYQGKFVSHRELAAQACRIEIEILKEPIGKQDQYAVAFGGLNSIRFNQDGSVDVHPVVMPRARHVELSGNLLMFFTGTHRNASQILSGTEKRRDENLESKRILKGHADRLSQMLSQGELLNGFGDMLNAGWETKKKLSGDISNSDIDLWYDTALKAGARGGKLLGAGGGGFLLLYVEPEKQAVVRNALAKLAELEFSFEYSGSVIIFAEQQ
jgi:D-glycero-alpha-D-manno-heptose-7-phosphate kinase